MPLRPHQVFNLIVASAALALLAEGVLLWKLSARPTPETAPNSAAPNSAAPHLPATSPLFVAPGLASPRAPQSGFEAPASAPKTGASERVSKGAGAKTPPLSETKRLSAKKYFEAGTDALKRKDANSALANFRRVAQIAPDHLPTRLNLALLYLSARRPADAIPHLQRAAQLAPNLPAPRFQLAQAYLALRKPQLAIAPLQSVVRLAPEERAARALLGQVYAGQKRPREAYAQWSALAQSEQRDAPAHLEAATFAMALRQPREAERWLRLSQTASPRDPRAALMLGQLLMGQKQPKRAAQALEAAAKAAPQVFEIYPALADARLASGDWKGARGALQTALQRLPKGQTPAQKARISLAEGQLHLSLGRVLGQNKQSQAARIEFARAAVLLPREAEPRGLLGLAALQSGDKKTAQSALQSALELDPTRTRDRLTLAQLLAQTGDFRGADAQFTLYTKSQPRDLTALAQWSQVARNLKQPEKAAQILVKIAGIDGKNPAPLLEAGSLLREAGRAIPALSLFERALARRPDDAGALFEVARLQSALKRPEALGSWQKFIAARPEWVPAYTSLLEAGERAGQSTGTRLFLARQMARGQENPRALSAVLRFYRQKGRNSQAQALLADLVKRNPRDKFARAALDSFNVKPGGPKPPLLAPMGAAPMGAAPVGAAPTPIPAGSVTRVPVR